MHAYLIMGKNMTGACIRILVRLHMNNMTLEAILNVNYTSVEAVQAWDRTIANVRILLADGCKKNNFELFYLVLL
jgi:hypothetical protein